jgi:DUF917 family protein
LNCLGGRKIVVLDAVRDDASGLNTPEDVDAFVLGLTLFGTGGGGPPERGRAFLLEHVENGRPIRWTPLESLPADAWTCSVFGMGSIAPHDPMPDEERRRLGFGDQRHSRPGVQAVEELAAYLKVDITALVPFELGGFNTTVAIDAAVRMGLPVLDGDFAGRAVPEMSQALPAILGYPTWPLAICDNWGSTLILKDAPSPAIAERLGKMISIVTKTPMVTATCAHAAFPLQAARLPQAMVPGSLSQALRVGRRVFQARAEGQDPVEAAREALDGWVLFRGRVSGRDWQSIDGYMMGSTRLWGDREWKGVQGSIWFKNENHVLLLNDAPAALSPDLIMVVNDATGEPRTNTVLAPDDRVAVLGARADQRFRTGAPLAETEPRHYGFLLDYQPIEVLAGRHAR